jgi:S-adenosylmethionine hydrolase
MASPVPERATPAPRPLIALFTDFGLAGPYTGQVKAVLHRVAPKVPVIDLFADAPAAAPRPAAYLLAAYAAWFSPGTVLLCVVDPGVGGARAALVVEADGRRYVGPDNGLFEIVLRRARTASVAEIVVPPCGLSASFHGRDLFAPVAAEIARGRSAAGRLREAAALRRPDWPDDLAEIVYVDHFGNALTGLRAPGIAADARLIAGGRVLARARTFSAVGEGEPFWYENANGLADQALGLAIGSPVEVRAPR